MRMGPRFKVHCSNIVSIHGHEINSICYLGVYLTANNAYSCPFSHAKISKRSFYRPFNAIFGSVGHVASEEVVVELKPNSIKLSGSNQLRTSSEPAPNQLA